ncbi:MAG: aminotransferase class III-fold pyridoxal phosphate-dependent enzyme, partial [Sulfuricella sp.]
AILVEPVQGEGGIQIPGANYLRELRSLCDAHGWLLMLDEVQTGIGRTGTWFAFQQAGIVPDVMALAKGLGGGFPIGACLAKGAVAEVFKPGNHGSTFGGNPLACAAALATLTTIEELDLCRNAAEIGDFIRTSLTAQLDGVAGVVQVRNAGLMVGIELNKPCAELVKRGLEQGFLINVTADSVVRLLPPLIMTRDEAAQLITMLSKLIKEFLAG